MTSRKPLKIIGAVVIGLILAYSFIPSWVPYEEQILNHREEINDFMKNDSESPLPDSVQDTFQSLKFYPVNPELKVDTRLELLKDDQKLVMGTSDGKTREYIRYAYARFELDGQSQRLTLLKPVDQNEEGLFLPFGDPTNGSETYGGGRYLDLETTDKQHLTIDFNLAYNPYCVYSEGYSCPIPPSENQLEVPVRAGEKNY